MRFDFVFKLCTFNVPIIPTSISFDISTSILEHVPIIRISKLSAFFSYLYMACPLYTISKTYPVPTLCRLMNFLLVLELMLQMLKRRI